MIISKVSALHGEITVPGDKSVSHRSVMFGALAKGTTEITGFLPGADCLATIDCFCRLGISIDVKSKDKDTVSVHGRGLHGLSKPDSQLDVGNSGTTTRLISGILAGQPFETELSGDASLNSRPMERVIEPLTQMGADITSINHNGCAPLLIRPGSLHGIHYHSKVASAQVKSAILLAGLYADGITAVTEPALSRNHTELMLQSFGAEISVDGTTSTIKPCAELYGQKIDMPGDISSAAYFIAAGLLVPGSELLIKSVGINPTRAGILKVCRKMGGNITLVNERSNGGEPTADLLVRHSSLHGTVIEGEIIPALIDEIPVIAVLAAYADGTTTIKDAAELKVKETDRIQTVTENLKAMGADIIPTDDGMIINGGKALHGAVIKSYLDHRIAMSFAIAGLRADGVTELKDSHCVGVSYPNFFPTLQKLM